MIFSHLQSVGATITLSLSYSGSLILRTNPSYGTHQITLTLVLTFHPPASMNRLNSDVLPVIFRGLPFSKRKIALLTVCSRWRSALLLPQSHEVLHEEDALAKFKQGDLSVPLLAVLPVANCPARFAAGGLEHIQTAFITLPGTLCYESRERWSVICWNGIFPNVRELHLDNEASWCIDSVPCVPLPCLLSFPRLSLLNLDWTWDSNTGLPEITQPLPSDCQVVLHMYSDYVEDAFYKLKNTGLEEVLTRLELSDYIAYVEREDNESCSISMSLLSSFQRLEEIVIHLV